MCSYQMLSASDYATAETSCPSGHQLAKFRTTTQYRDVKALIGGESS